MFLLLSLFACQPPSGELLDEDGDGAQAKFDCDDADPAINPSAAEVCDGVDNDCDGETDEIPDGGSTTVPALVFADLDGDGYGSTEATFDRCNPDATVTVGGDCDDESDLIFPDAPEVCDGVDNDCDTRIDDEDENVDPLSAETWHTDADGDGYGDELDSTVACIAPAGTVLDGTDCDDGVGAINPGATETCDEEDNDCDGLVDDGDDSLDLLSAPEGWDDADEDGYGDATAYLQACSLPHSYVDNPDDCDDTDRQISPDADEVCDTIDNDCDDLVDAGDPSVDLSTGFVAYDDDDADGYGEDRTATSTCTLAEGQTTVGGDCDDAEASIHPDAAEVCNRIDDDCDLSVDDDDADVEADTDVWRDADGDGWGDPAMPDRVCVVPDGWVENDSDCDDDDAGTSPVEPEVCNGRDDDCDGFTDDEDADVDLTTGLTFFQDRDADGHGGPTTLTACAQPEGATVDADDCDDSEASVSPDGSETCDDGVDQDCDGLDRACAPLLGTLDPSEYAYAQRHGEASSMAYGSSLTVLDWDGDGQGDLAVGASGSSEGGASAGAVYLHTGLVTGTQSYADDDDGSFLGTTVGALAGTAVAAAPDLDGDGDDELFVTDNAGVETGLVLGGTASGNLRSVRAWSESCVDAVDLGDDDHDGVHTWGCANGTGGSVRVYEGVPGAPLATYAGSATADYVGYHAAAGDIDGDGVNDLFVGAPGINDGPRTDVGGAVVLQAPFADASLDSTSLTVLGDTTSGSLGTQVALADLDGDGGLDLLASSPYATAGGTNSGAWYGWSGLPSTAVGPADAAFTLNGDMTSEYLGRGHLTARDLDGDGAAEIAVASSTVAKSGSGSGAAWLLYGPHSGTWSVADAATWGAYFMGEAASAALGSDLAFADDLTGDGVPELILGSSGLTAPSGNRAGVVYLLAAQ